MKVLFIILKIIFILWLWLLLVWESIKLLAIAISGDKFINLLIYIFFGIYLLFALFGLFISFF